MPSPDPTMLARAAASTCALKTVQQHGINTGADILAGYVAGFVDAYAAVVGWPDTIELLNQLSAPHRVPLRGAKPKLVYPHGGDAA